MAAFVASHIYITTCAVASKGNCDIFLSQATIVLKFKRKNGKIPLKNSWIRIVISTKIE